MHSSLSFSIIGISLLLVGEIGGTVSSAGNTSDDRAPEYARPKKLRAGEGKIKVPGGDSGPVVVDWDSDEDLDLLVGTGNGGVDLHRNVSSDGDSELDARTELVGGRTWVHNEETSEYEIEPATEFHPGEMGSRLKLAVCDWNADGGMDLRVGDSSSVAGFEPDLSEEQIALKARIEEEMDEFNDRRISLWGELRREVMDEIGEQRDGESEAEHNNRLWEAEKKIQEAHPEFSELEERFTHGHVWAYPSKLRS